MEGVDTLKGWNIMMVGPIAQLVEPPAHNRKVPGSNPGGPIGKTEGDFHQLSGGKNIPHEERKKSAPTGALFLFCLNKWQWFR